MQQGRRGTQSKHTTLFYQVEELLSLNSGSCWKGHDPVWCEGNRATGNDDLDNSGNSVVGEQGTLLKASPDPRIGAFEQLLHTLLLFFKKVIRTGAQTRGGLARPG